MLAGPVWFHSPPPETTRFSEEKQQSRKMGTRLPPGFFQEYASMQMDQHKWPPCENTRFGAARG